MRKTKPIAFDNKGRKVKVGDTLVPVTWNNPKYKHIVTDIVVNNRVKFADKPLPQAPKYKNTLRYIIVN